jgi:hypothetical protein
LGSDLFCYCCDAAFCYLNSSRGSAPLDAHITASCLTGTVPDIAHHQHKEKSFCSSLGTASTGPAEAVAPQAMADQEAIWACYDDFNPFSGLPVPGGLSERLWADCQQQALEALHHPFITALASGTMNR